jgi:hypothetical protein
MRPEDWVPAPIQPGQYSNPEPLTGYRRRDGLGGNVLHPVYGDGGFEARLSQTYAALQAEVPRLHLARYAVRMPYWRGCALPSRDDYALVDTPEPLTTTSVTIILVPQAQIQGATIGYHFYGDRLPALRERMAGTHFRGIAGNLGYYMTAALIGNESGQAKAWAHSVRYPAYPLPDILSYVGFHLSWDEMSGEMYSSFQGAHPGTVGVRRDGTVDILPWLGIASYEVALGGQRFVVDAINDPQAVDRDVVLYTPALVTDEIGAYIAASESTAGAAEGWQRYAPRVPLADVDERLNVFVANEGNGQMPVEKALVVWAGPAPVPSFGAVLSFKRAYFEALFGDREAFVSRILGARVQVVPTGDTAFDDYARMLGGLVPAVVDGQHIYQADTVDQVMANLSRYGNANSPLAQAGRETRNFDPTVREPAGVLLQTGEHIGWGLFDGRHELSIGASVVDVGVLLHKLQADGLLPAIEQAVFVDGGSAMKAYHIGSDKKAVQLDLLNRVAAGSRNRAGADPDGLNLYSTLALSLAGD